MEGVVKFYKPEKGWGAVTSPAVPGDVWVQFSIIRTHCGQLEAGDIVEFDVEEAPQTPFRYRATRAALVRHGPAPTLRRRAERVDIAEPGTPDTPLTPKRPRPS